VIKTVLQVVHRKATVTSNGDFEQPLKVVLNKKNKKNGQCHIAVGTFIRFVRCWF